MPHAIAPDVVAKLPYDLLGDFSPITLIGKSPLLIFTDIADDSTDLKTFLKTANSTKGGPPAIAHSGSGTIRHLVGEMFAQRSKIKFNMVPYRGTAPALVDVSAVTVAALFATLASGAALLSAGKIHALAVTSNVRLVVPASRDVPIFNELGVTGLVLNQWWVLVAPITTPVNVLDKLRADSLAALASAGEQARMSTLGVDLKGTIRDALRGFMRSGSERWQTVARDIGLKPQQASFCLVLVSFKTIRHQGCPLHHMHHQLCGMNGE